MMEVKDEKHLLNGLWNWDCNYDLDGDAFTEEVENDIKKKTGLSKGTLGDWWVFDEGNPILNWNQLILLALNILNCKATKLFVHGLYLKKIPTALMKTNVEKLPCLSVRGAKRVNANADDYTDYSEMMGIGGMLKRQSGLKDEDLIKKVGMSNSRFRLSGKDESCCVEGTWLHWCMFACNILASKNTEIVAKELYAPGLANHNY